MSEKRQPQPGDGVMGHAARPQQFDTSAPWAPAPARPASATHTSAQGFAAATTDDAFAGPAEIPADPDHEPADRHEGFGKILGVAAVPPHVADIVPAEVYEIRPAGKRWSARGPSVTPPEPAFVARFCTSTPVPALRPRPARRRLQAAVATVAAVAGLAAVGFGYIAFTHTDHSTQAKAQALPDVPPITGTLPGGGEAPGAEPVATLPAGPSTTASTPASTTAATTSAGTTVTTPSARVIKPTPGNPSSGDPLSASPTGTDSTAAAPLLRQAPTATATAGTLQATLSYTAAGRNVGWSRYQGTIQIDSTDTRDVGDWRLTLTVPGGNKVVPNGPVVVAQDGESVEFTPRDGGTVAAGGSLTFTFTIAGVLTNLPTDCQIDDQACH